MFMQSIINNQRTQYSRTSTSRTSTSRTSTSRTRQTFTLNNGYNRLQSSPAAPAPPPAPPPTPTPTPTPPNNSNTIVDPPPETDVSENIIQYQLFNTNIVYVTFDKELENKLKSLLLTFQYESFNIRFFHNEHLNIENINNHVDTVLNNINELEIRNMLNNDEAANIHKLKIRLK